MTNGLLQALAWTIEEQLPYSKVRLGESDGQERITVWHPRGDETIITLDNERYAFVAINTLREEQEEDDPNLTDEQLAETWALEAKAEDTDATLRLLAWLKELAEKP